MTQSINLFNVIVFICRLPLRVLSTGEYPSSLSLYSTTVSTDCSHNSYIVRYIEKEIEREREKKQRETDNDARNSYKIGSNRSTYLHKIQYVCMYIC